MKDDNYYIKKSFIPSSKNITIEDKGNIVISIRNRDKYIDLLSILINHKITRIKELELSLEDLFIKLT